MQRALRLHRYPYPYPTPTPTPIPTCTPNLLQGGERPRIVVSLGKTESSRVAYTLARADRRASALLEN